MRTCQCGVFFQRVIPVEHGYLFNFLLFWVVLLLKERFGHENHVLSETAQLADMDLSRHLTSCVPLDHNPGPTAAA